jgi:predicted secreted hydrolase
MTTGGTIVDHGVEHKVKGTSWMDHEYGSDMLSAAEVGWNWYSVQLSNNMDLMLYMFRHPDGSFDPESSGTLVMPDGTSKHLKNTDFSVQAQGSWQSHASGAKYPLGWAIKVPGENIDLTVEPLKKNQELDTQQSSAVTYWEGDCKIEGTAGGGPDLNHKTSLKQEPIEELIGD